MAGSKIYYKKLAKYRAKINPERVTEMANSRLLRYATQSKTYTTSKRKLIGRSLAASKKAAGLRITDPGCVCGKCLKCRRRKTYAVEQSERGGFYWDDGEQTVSAFEMEQASITRLIKPLAYCSFDV